VGEAAPEQAGLVVVDPDATARDQVEALEDVLARPILAVDPGELDLAGNEEIQNAAAFVLCWDLAVRSGADLIEEIRRHAVLRERKILIAMDAPTRERVLLAMRLGADGVVHRPYDGDELLACLERAGLSRSAPAA